MSEQPNPIDIGELVRRLAQPAIEFQFVEYKDLNHAALDLLYGRRGPINERVEGVKHWLDRYKVLMGFTAEQRLGLTRAVLQWADNRNLGEGLNSSEEIARAHDDLMACCCIAHGRERGFTSLASKALWLCYPDSVPIFDNLARRSLQMLTKLEPSLTVPDSRCSEYGEFVHYWKQLYHRYGDCLSAPLAEHDPDKKLHKAKVFDQVLWLLGEPSYRLAENTAADPNN